MNPSRLLFFAGRLRPYTRHFFHPFSIGAALAGFLQAGGEFLSRGPRPRRLRASGGRFTQEMTVLGSGSVWRLSLRERVAFAKGENWLTAHYHRGWKGDSAGLREKRVGHFDERPANWVLTLSFMPQWVQENEIIRQVTRCWYMNRENEQLYFPPPYLLKKSSGE